MIQKIKSSTCMNSKLKNVAAMPVSNGDSLSEWAANAPAKMLNMSAIHRGCAKLIFPGNSTVVLPGGSK